MPWICAHAHSRERARAAGSLRRAGRGRSRRRRDAPASRGERHQRPRSGCRGCPRGGGSKGERALHLHPSRDEGIRGTPLPDHHGCVRCRRPQRCAQDEAARQEIEQEPRPMKFGIFYEHQLPRPWHDGDELKLFQDALGQVELADRLGIDHAWEVEHHFLEEYSHSSAPEVFLAACSQRTKNIRLGHGIVLLPPGYNHPARVAERIATLDLVSNGRVEFGTGESSAQLELGGFNIPREDKRAMWQESLGAIARMFVENPFMGHEGKYFSMPVRNVVPKPVQKPHPPLWVACSRRETIHLAAKL